MPDYVVAIDMTYTRYLTASCPAEALELAKWDLGVLPGDVDILASEVEDE